MLLNFFFPYKQRYLIFQLAQREVIGRYRGSMLGVAWSFVSPLLMLFVYSFVFVGIFKARWPGQASGDGFEFAIQVFAGLAVFNFFSDVVTRSPRLILDQPNLVKKVVFPLEVLPWACLLAASFHFFISAVILSLAYFCFYQQVSMAFLFMPIVILPLLPLLLGLSWLLSSLGVYLRDLAQIVGFVANLVLFMSPVFYAVESVPSEFHQWIFWGPITLIIENVRNVLAGTLPDWGRWTAYFLAASMICGVGAFFFHRLRKGFSDVL